VRVPHGVGQRLLKDPERSGRHRVRDFAVDVGVDVNPQTRRRRDPARLVLDRAAQITMVECRRPQIGGDPADHGDPDVDLTHRRLQLVDHVARRLQLLEAPQRRGEIELDPREQLAQLVVQLAGNPRALLLAHPLDTLRQGAQMRQ